MERSAGPLPVFTKKAPESQVIYKSQILQLSSLKDGGDLLLLQFLHCHIFPWKMLFVSAVSLRPMSLLGPPLSNISFLIHTILHQFRLIQYIAQY